jgi:hypothetical protein
MLGAMRQRQMPPAQLFEAQSPFPPQGWPVARRHSPVPLQARFPLHCSVVDPAATGLQSFSFSAGLQIWQGASGFKVPEATNAPPIEQPATQWWVLSQTEPAAHRRPRHASSSQSFLPLQSSSCPFEQSTSDASVAQVPLQHRPPAAQGVCAGQLVSSSQSINPSRLSSTLLLQLVSFEQIPATQVRPPVHRVPQVPQFRSSNARSTHAVPQHIFRDAEQFSWQLPETGPPSARLSVVRQIPSRQSSPVAQSSFEVQEKTAPSSDLTVHPAPTPSPTRRDRRRRRTASQ